MRNILLIWVTILSNIIFVRNQANNTTGQPLNNTTLSNATNITTIDPRKYSEGKFYKTVPSFIPEIGQNSSQCFTNLKNVIGYFSDFEQAALVLAANSNNQSDRCFDCNVYSQYLPTAIEKFNIQISDLITQNREKKRNGFSCFLNFTLQGMEPLINSSLAETVLSYLYFYSDSNICITKFLQDISQVILENRRFFCTTIDNMKVMALNDTSGQMVGFKWTQPQANLITNSLVQLAGCLNKERAIIPQTTVNAMSTIALSESCHTSGRNVSSLNATSTGPLPEGRRLMSGKRFLETNVTSIDSTNMTNTTTAATNTTSSNSTNGDSTAQPSNATSTSSTNSTSNTTQPLVTANPNSTNNSSNLNNTTTQPASASNTTSSENNSTTPVGAAGPSSSNSTTNTTSNNTTQPTNPAGSSNNTSSNNTTVPTNGSSSSNTTSVNTTSTVTPASNTTNTTSTNTTATNFVGAHGSSSTNETTSNTTLTQLTASNNNTVSSASNNTTTNTTLLQNNTTSTVSNQTLPVNNTNTTEYSIISASNSSAFTSQSIAPAIPNILLLQSGPNRFNKYLNIGNNNTAVVINNLLNFTSEDNLIYKSIKDLANATTTKNNTLYTNLGLNLNHTLLSSYSFQCMPKAPSIFILNMLKGIPLLEEFQKSNCTIGNDSIVTITNNTVTCDNCNSSLLDNEIKFINSTNIPNQYFLSTGCLNGSRFKFATWKDYSGVPFASYEKDSVNLDSVCMSKTYNCASNKSSYSYCPQNFMTTKCRNQITNKCTSSGLLSTIQALNSKNNVDFIIPQECSLEKLASLMGNNQTSTGINNQLPKSYVDSCFNWFLTNVFINSFNPNVTKLTNLDLFFNSNNSISQNSNLRILQTMTNATLAPGQSLVVAEADDPTRKDPIANKISAMKINSNSTVVDGMTVNSNPTNRLDALLVRTAEYNPNATVTVTNPTEPQPNVPISPPIRLSSSYLYVHSMLYSLIVIFLLIN